MTVAAPTTTTKTAAATTKKEKEKEIANLLVSFAEQNAFLYFNTHTNLRSLIQRRMFLETYDRENALAIGV